MNNLTSTLLVKHYNYDIEEWSKQGSALPFDSGREQRVVSTSIPAIHIGVSYRGLTESDYNSLRTAYEGNHSNTFICDLSSFIDKRPDFMTINSSVWAFSEFNFTIDAKSKLYSGKIGLVTSVFFNFTEYQDLHTETSSYTRNTSIDTSFQNVLDVAPPNQSVMSYLNNALKSNIGQSARHGKDKGGLLRTWTLSWLIDESSFIQLLTFYRKSAGIMGEFGLVEVWTTAEQNTNARFMQDSFKYNKQVNGFYVCRAEFQEVKI